ncbi:CYFA0S01e18030g1_1 [Cyberlindnera fabianii]|uniref:Dolichyl-diphosphooligosaccharide--protein glycosyltransferase subunit OST2 n=1 Tax=Cyberlindnera fabianii TaxID=36022 RepID=A0A061ASY1_CYBFA|nr:Dolichyl-diphosphooligosaccharide--protein glycosyltransferase subunit DAD1 [Cyberlindnera fabianii]CDR37829.1 CYFA0S01e18030g1_1 [Cyberlindnera fabianii]
MVKPVKPVVATSVSSKSKANMFAEFQKSIQVSYKSYIDTLTPRLKLVDIFLVFLVFVALVQFVFAVVLGNFPFNAFLGGFISTVGQFVLTVSLRLQTAQQNQKEFPGVSPERAIGDYIFASLVLHFIVYHFIN